MEKFFRNKEIIFWSIGAVIALFLIFYLFFSLSFLAKKASKVFGVDLMKSAKVVKFNLEKAQQIRK